MFVVRGPPLVQVRFTVVSWFLAVPMFPRPRSWPVMMLRPRSLAGSFRRNPGTLRSTYTAARCNFHLSIAWTSVGFPRLTSSPLSNASRISAAVASPEPGAPWLSLRCLMRVWTPPPHFPSRMCSAHSLLVLNGLATVRDIRDRKMMHTSSDCIVHSSRDNGSLGWMSYCPIYCQRARGLVLIRTTSRILLSDHRSLLQHIHRPGAPGIDGACGWRVLRAMPNYQEEETLVNI